MIEAILLAGASTGFAAGTLGYLLGRRGRTPEAPSPPPLNTSSFVERRELESGRRALEQKLHGLKARYRRALQLPNVSREHFGPEMGSRPSAAQLERVATRIRGLTLIDQLVVADRDGLARSRTAGAGVDDLAALGSVLAADGVLGRLVSATMLTPDAQFVCGRRLPAWAEGFWLLAKTTNTPPAELALDSAVAFAELICPDLPIDDAGITPSPDRTLHRFGHERGAHAETLVSELAGLATETKSHTVALLNDGQVMLGASHWAPDREALIPVSRTMQSLRARAARRLRAQDLLRVEVADESGMRWMLAPLQLGGRLTVLMGTTEGAIDPLMVDRLMGRVRRAISTRQSNENSAPGADEKNP